VVGQAVQLVQHDHVAVQRRQIAQRPMYLVAQFTPGGVTGGVGVRVNLSLPQNGIFIGHRWRAVFAPMLQAVVQRNAVHPR
jgi:hypothetical protein